MGWAKRLVLGGEMLEAAEAARIGLVDHVASVEAFESEVERLIRFAVRHKELKHKINEPGFVRASRSMSQIGG